MNSYLLEESGEVTIIDAGAPAYWDALPSALAGMGRSLDDVRAVLLTHGHSDHVGFAERIRKERNVPVHVHTADAALARGEEGPKGQSFNGARPMPLIGFLLYAIRHGMLRTTPILAVSTFADGSTLDAPGSPRVIHMPGHTAGMCALHAAAHDVLFVGDGLATYNVLSGKRGPQLSPFTADYAQARESLAKIENVAARVVLPGHGDPWTAGPAAAVREAREAVRI